MGPVLTGPTTQVYSHPNIDLAKDAVDGMPGYDFA